jgi:hypothetical protein
MRNIFLLLILVASFSAHAANPDWISSGVIQEFNDQRYITALGEGSSLEDAGKQAYARLAEQIKVSISSQSNIVQEYRSTSNKFEKSENVDIQIRTQVDLSDIEGIQIVERFHQESTNTYFAFAVLNKVKTATRLEFKVEGLFEQVRSQLENIKGDIASGQVSKGVSNLVKTSHVFEEIASTVELHQLFGNSPSNGFLRDDMFQLIGDFDQYLSGVFSQIAVSAPGGTEQSGSPELGAPAPYEVSFSFNGQPLKNIPVRARAETSEANIDLANNTSQQGDVSVLIRSVPYSDKEKNKVVVELDLYADLFANAVPGLSLFVLLNRKSEVTIRLSTRVKSEHHDFLDIVVSDNLASLLSTQNYQVITEEEAPSGQADYILEIKGTVVDLAGIGSLRFSKISGVVRIKSGESKRVIKTIRIDANATKAGALSNADAAEKAAGKLIEAIQDQLLSTLEKNLGRS